MLAMTYGWAMQEVGWLRKIFFFIINKFNKKKSIGTEPSRKHIRLDSEGKTQKEYWNFSWHGAYYNSIEIYKCLLGF